MAPVSFRYLSQLKCPAERDITKNCHIGTQGCPFNLWPLTCDRSESGQGKASANRLVWHPLAISHKLYSILVWNVIIYNLNCSPPEPFLSCPVAVRTRNPVGPGGGATGALPWYWAGTREGRPLRACLILLPSFHSVAKGEREGERGKGDRERDQGRGERETKRDRVSFLT